MTFPLLFGSNNALLAQGGSAVLPTIVRKTADESVTSSATLQDDDELLFAVGASETWAFEFYIFFTAHADGDLDLAISVPSGATVIYGNASDTSNTVRTSSGGELFVAGITGVNATVLVYGTIVNSTTAGDVQLRWAQSTSNGAATTILDNSYLLAWSQ